VILFGF